MTFCNSGSPHASLMWLADQESEDCALFSQRCAGWLRLGRGHEQDGLLGRGAGDPEEQLRPDGRREGRIPGVWQQRQREHQQGGVEGGDGQLGPAMHRGVCRPLSTSNISSKTTSILCLVLPFGVIRSPFVNIYTFDGSNHWTPMYALACYWHWLTNG